jgi:hypothetical protein
MLAARPQSRALNSIRISQLGGFLNGAPLAIAVSGAVHQTLCPLINWR